MMEIETKNNKRNQKDQRKSEKNWRTKKRRKEEKKKNRESKFWAKRTYFSAYPEASDLCATGVAIPPAYLFQEQARQLIATSLYNWYPSV
jgi:hypothetical protein